jgi:hypothetical protein
MFRLLDALVNGVRVIEDVKSQLGGGTFGGEGVGIRREVSRLMFGANLGLKREEILNVAP